SERSVAMGGAYLDDTLAQFDDRDIECTPAKVVDGDLLILLVIQPMGEGSRGGFVDDARDFKASDLAGVPGSLSSRICEVSRHRDDRPLDPFAEMLLGDIPEPPEDEGRDFLGSIHPTSQTDLLRCAHLAFDRLDGPIWLENVLIASWRSHV